MPQDGPSDGRCSQKDLCPPASGPTAISVNHQIDNKIKGARPVRRSRPDLQPVPHVDFSHGGPRVRIHLPPPRVSPSPASTFVGRERRLSARVCVAGLATGSAETRRVYRYSANRRKYLCRAMFQYRSAADGVGENADAGPDKVGPSLGLTRGTQPSAASFGCGTCRRTSARRLVLAQPLIHDLAQQTVVGEQPIRRRARRRLSIPIPSGLLPKG